MSVYTRDEYITRMYDQFVTSLLWSELDDEDEALDRNYEDDDIDQDTRDEIMNDCEGLFDQHWQLLHDLEPSDVGHDFVMTRNGHGCGFWDGDYAEPAATVLTKAAKAYGTLGLFVGDDEKLHGHN